MKDIIPREFVHRARTRASISDIDNLPFLRLTRAPILRLPVLQHEHRTRPPSAYPKPRSIPPHRLNLRCTPYPTLLFRLERLAPPIIAAIQTRAVAQQTLRIGVARGADGFATDDRVVSAEVLVAQRRLRLREGALVGAVGG